MLTFTSLEQNHNFLILETRAQFQDAVRFLESPDEGLQSRMSFRNELIRNMKNTMENDCFQRLFATPERSGAEVQKIRCLHRMALACRRISSHCVNICGQARRLPDPARLHAFNWRALSDVAARCLDLVPGSLDAPREADALAICRGEAALDRLYDDLVDEVEAGSKAEPGRFREHLRVVLVGRYLEGIGDELLRMGEALLSALVGERVQFYEYEAMHRGLERLGGGALTDSIKYKAFWGSRSGCVIGMVTSRGRRAVFKEGPVEKVRREKDNMVEWEGVWPGLTPRVYDYFENNGLGSMLMEEVAGTPLDEVLLTGSEVEFERALAALNRTLTGIWERTLRPCPPDTAGFMDQILARLDKVRQVHADLGSPGGDPQAALERIRAARELEAQLPAPFCVRNHGDCNLNNLFYDPLTDQVRLVDLYRSRQGDCLQDVSVNMISAFRLPVFDAPARGRIGRAIASAHECARSFALSRGDATLSARLALALARSLVTSTRFELRLALASAMFRRAWALLDALAAHSGQPWETFETPLGLLALDSGKPGWD